MIGSIDLKPLADGLAVGLRRAWAACSGHIVIISIAALGVSDMCAVAAVYSHYDPADFSSY